MADYAITAEKRTIFGKQLRRERKRGKIPAILYGHGVENVPLFLGERDFLHVLERAGKNTIVKLSFVDAPGKDADIRNVLIHDVDYDALAGKPLHVDLYQVRMGEKVRVLVPLLFVGESPAVEVSGGVLVKAMQSLPVEALPHNLPHEISVDISPLHTFEDTIYVKDLSIPEGVTVLVDAETPVASVAPPRSEEELKALEEKVEEKLEEVKVEVEEKRLEAEAREAEEPAAAAEAPKPQAPKEEKK